LGRKIRYSGRAIEVDVDFECKAVKCVSRKRGHCPSGIGKHAEGERATRSGNPIRRTQRRAGKGDIEGKSRAECEPLKVVVERRPIIEGQRRRQGPASISGQCRTALQCAVASKGRNLDRCGLGYQWSWIEVEIKRSHRAADRRGVDRHGVSDGTG